MWYVYIVKCRDSSLYTGLTNDLEKRLATHNAGCGAKYTRSRRPVSLAYSERLGTKGKALAREWQIKRLRRRDKLTLIAGTAG